MSDTIRTLEDVSSLGPMAALVAAPLGWAHRRDSPAMPVSGEMVTSLSSPLPAWVSGGRWIVMCPCGGAQLASREDHRFFCVDCLNAQVGGQWRTVSWPDDAAAIEAALLRRPESYTRTWLPTETLTDLLAENAEHGVTQDTSGNGSQGLSR
jgi:hypothetical protein